MIAVTGIFGSHIGATYPRNTSGIKARTGKFLREAYLSGLNCGPLTPVPGAEGRKICGFKDGSTGAGRFSREVFPST
jgi:hypothetical protein